MASSGLNPSSLSERTCGVVLGKAAFGRKRIQNIYNSEYLYCVRGGNSYRMRLDFKHLSFERRIYKKSAGESWQPQRSGQLDFTPRPATHVGWGQDGPAAGGGHGTLGDGGHCAARDRRRQDGV